MHCWYKEKKGSEEKGKGLKEETGNVERADDGSGERDHLKWLQLRKLQRETSGGEEKPELWSPELIIG